MDTLKVHNNTKAEIVSWWFSLDNNLSLQNSSITPLPEWQLEIIIRVSGDTEKDDFDLVLGSNSNCQVVPMVSGHCSLC